MKKIALSIIVASAAALTANAEIKDHDQLVTHTELGYIQTSGNTQTQTFNIDSKAKKAWGVHVGNILLDAQYAKDGSRETKNKFLTEATYDYEFTERFSFNYIFGYKKDRFSGFASQLYTGPGGKYKLIVSEIDNLTVDGNLMYAVDSYDATYLDANNKVISYPNSIDLGTLQRGAYEEKYISYRAKGVYTRQVFENLKFDQELSFRGSFKSPEQFFVYSKTAFSSKFTDIFSAGISYKVDYINTPARGKDTTDTTLTANLIIDY